MTQEGYWSLTLWNHRDLHMCVLYVSFRSKVTPRTFDCVAMGSAVLFIFRSRLLLYSAGSGVNSLQPVELSQQLQTAVQIVSNPPAPSNGGSIYRSKLSQPFCSNFLLPLRCSVIDVHVHIFVYCRKTIMPIRSIRNKIERSMRE